MTVWVSGFQVIFCREKGVFAKAQNSANDLDLVGEPSKMDSLDYLEIKLLSSRMEIMILNRSTQRGPN